MGVGAPRGIKDNQVAVSPRAMRELIATAIGEFPGIELMVLAARIHPISDTMTVMGSEDRRSSSVKARASSPVTRGDRRSSPALRRLRQLLTHEGP